MTTRRNFLKTAGAVTAGIAATSTASASTRQDAMTKKYSGPHEMPTNVTLLSMQNADGSETLGVKLDADAVLDVRKASHLLGIAAPVTLEELLKEGNARGLNELVAAAKTSPKAKPRWSRNRRSPLAGCSAIRARSSASGSTTGRTCRKPTMKLPTVPILFNKYNNALAAHNCTIKLPPKDVAYKFDYETELLIVMGKKTRNVSEADALSYVAGYCTAHDFSARDLQLETPSVQWMIGKTLDSFGPIGPYFVSADLVGDPNNLKIETHVNGEVRQSSNTSFMIFNPAETDRLHQQDVDARAR